MPANLTPVYYEAERKYKQARSLPERVVALQEMLAVMPKHKGTDHLQADVKARIARLLEEVDRPASGPKRAASPFNIRKEGAGQMALVGFANAGKSAILASFTGAPARVASYPFSTKTPTLGMLPFENVHIQFVDIPAPDAPEVQTALYGLFRNADLLALVADLSDEPVRRIGELLAELERWGFRILGRDDAREAENPQTEKRALVVGAKGDISSGLDGYQVLVEAYQDRFPVILTSAEEGLGGDELAQAAYETLDLMRVYTKAPGRDVDLSTPLVLPHGSTVLDVAEDVHKDWLKRFKYGLVWGSSGKFEGQRVGRDHVLADGDVVELHA